MTPFTLDQVLGRARAALAQTLALDAHSASLEAQLLLAESLGRPRAWLIAHGREPLAAPALAAFEALLARRLGGEPMAYILGRREFYGLELRVTPEVLIPRPDTELLVEWALALIPEGKPWSVLDLGTGSGAVALAIARHRPAARVTAVDRSPGALAVARENARRLALPQVRFLEGDWFTPLGTEARFQLIVANPPYVAEDDPHLTQGDVSFEPRMALAAGPAGLDALDAIIAGAPRHLVAGGWLLLEHGWDQGPACRARLAKAGFGAIASRRDLGDRERVTGGRLA